MLDNLFILTATLSNITWVEITVSTIFIILAVAGFWWQVHQSRKSDFKEIMEKKADKILVKKDFDNVETKITNLTNLHSSNEKKINGIDTKIDNLSIRIDKKLENHQKQITEIIINALDKK